jgi:hypothetical protein
MTCNRQHLSSARAYCEEPPTGVTMPALVNVTMPAQADWPPSAATSPRRPDSCTVPIPTSPWCCLGFLDRGDCGNVVELRVAGRAWRRRGRGVGERSPRRNGQRRQAESRASDFGARSARTRSPSTTTTEPVLQMAAINPPTLRRRRHAAPTRIPMPSMRGTEEVVILAAQPAPVGRSARWPVHVPLWPISHTGPRQAGCRLLRDRPEPRGAPCRRDRIAGTGRRVVPSRAARSPSACRP